MNTKDIANALADCLDEVLFPFYYKNETSLKYSHTLETIVGSGVRTYHQKKSSDKHIIVFGKKMIASKLNSLADASRWLTFKENKKYNFFNGEINALTLLSSVIIHEFGHYLQTVRGHRLYGSVHNSEFYKILNELHDSRFSTLVLDYLKNDSRTRNLAFLYDKPIPTIPDKFNHTDLFIGAELTSLLDKGFSEFFVATFDKKYAYCIHKNANLIISLPINQIDSISKSNSVPFIITSIGDIVDFKFKNKELNGEIIRYNKTMVVIKDCNGFYTLLLSNVIRKKEIQYSSENIKRGDVIEFNDEDGLVIESKVVKVKQRQVKTEFYRDNNVIIFDLPYYLILNRKL
jgi:hypothetical protein